MDRNHPTLGRRGKRLLAAALIAAAFSIGGVMTAAAIDQDRTPAQAISFYDGGGYFGYRDGGYVLAAGLMGGGTYYGFRDGF